jgi:hypothetical protein
MVAVVGDIYVDSVPGPDSGRSVEFVVSPSVSSDGLFDESRPTDSMYHMRTAIDGEYIPCGIDASAGKLRKSSDLTE